MSTRSTMGQSSNKFDRIDDTVQNLGLLQKSGKQLAYDITDVFRQMNNDITTLKSEKEFLVREMQRNERRTTSNSSKDKHVFSNAASTQTETSEEVSLSTISCKNAELDQKMITLLEQLKQDGSSQSDMLTTTVACSVLLPPSGDDKYIPTGTEHQKQLKLLQNEYEHVLKDKNCLNVEIKRLSEELMTYQSNKEQAKDRFKNLEQQILVLNEQLTKGIKETSTVGEEVYKVKNENKILQNNKAEVEQVNIDLRREMGEQYNRMEQLQNQVTKLEQQVDQSRKLLNKNSSRFENQNTDYVRLQVIFQSTEKEVKEQVKRVKTLEREKCDLKNRIKEYETNCSDHLQQIQRKDDRVTELEKNVLQIEDQYTIRGKVIDERQKEIEALKSEVNQKESELSHLRRDTEQSVKKLKHELSLEPVKSHNGKIENDDLRQTISGQDEEISDLLLNYNKLETDLAIKEANITQERNKLRNEIEELQSKEAILNKDYAALVQTRHTLEKEIEKLTTKERVKKYVSFHCVLKQPQSDQAMSGILSLLRQRFEDVDIEIVPESKSNKNVPLLVVLYNLSKLTDDAKGALIGIEASPDVALVVLHSKEIKKASNQVLTLPDLKKLGIIVDMSFISAKGLIHNELTANAVNQLGGYLNKY